MNLIWRHIVKKIKAGIEKGRKSAVTIPNAPDQGRRALEARIALGRSRAILNRVNSNEVRVERVTESMRKLGEDNGFAALIFRSLGGRG